MSKTKWFQYERVSDKAAAARFARTPQSPMTLKKRLALTILLVDLALVFVFAVWPLHEHHSGGTSFGPYGGGASTANCGSALKASGNCDSSIVGHRRTLLLELGGGALVFGLVGLELAFAVNSKEQSGKNREDEAESEGSDDATGGTAPEMSAETLDKLERLGRLRASGVLTDEEFADEKAKLLASR